MNDLKTRWQVTVETLSPLHIGSGTRLLLGYDLVAHQGVTYRIHEDAFFEDKLAAAEMEGQQAVQRLLLGRPASELLEPADYARDELFRYRLPGIPSSTADGSEVQEQIKDVFGRPYLPGSTLKGALRTILFWGMTVRNKRQLAWDHLGHRRTWASQQWERSAFGRNPNHDFLRALQVADSRPQTPQEARLTLRRVRIYPTRQRDRRGLDVDVEAVGAEGEFHLTIAIDEYGFRDGIVQELEWQGKRDWFLYLAALANERAHERLEAERDFFGRGAPLARDMCVTWLELMEGLADNECLLQIGWGAGWESKTLGRDVLGTDDRRFENLLQNYHLTKERERRPGDPFPKTRALALNEAEQPACPMGWVRVRLEGYEAQTPPPRQRPRREQREPSAPLTAQEQPSPKIPPLPERAVLVGTVKAFGKRGTIVLEGRLRGGQVIRVKGTGREIGFARTDLLPGLRRVAPGQRVSFRLGYSRSGNPKAEQVEPYEPSS